MTTALEARLAPKVLALVAKYGATATFTAYPDAASNTDDSTVVQGDPVVHTPKVTPPEPMEQRFRPDGSLVEERRVEFYLPTGAGTSSPLAFTPTKGMDVSIYGDAYKVQEIGPVASGDLILLYRIEAAA